MKDPIMSIEWVDAATLYPNPWNPNRVASAELRLLEQSILSTGWVQPVLVSRDGMVIDGFHRWSLSNDRTTQLFKRYKGKLPVARLTIDDREAMLITVRMNRAKGTHVAVLMHELVAALIDDHGMTPNEVAKGLGATRDEVDLLYRRNVFKIRNLDKYKYSKAWIPRESRIHGPPSERDVRLGKSHGQE